MWKPTSTASANKRTGAPSPYSTISNVPFKAKRNLFPKLCSKQGEIAIAMQNLQDREVLHEKGVNLILLPFYDAAEQAVEKIRATSN